MRPLRLKLFSQDEKKAGDAGYLISFNIIMLNTDLYNKTTREDRKINVHNFIKVSLSKLKKILRSRITTDSQMFSFFLSFLFVTDVY